MERSLSSYHTNRLLRNTKMLNLIWLILIDNSLKTKAIFKCVVILKLRKKDKYRVNIKKKKKTPNNITIFVKNICTYWLSLEFNKLCICYKI